MDRKVWVLLYKRDSSKFKNIFLYFLYFLINLKYEYNIKGNKNFLIFNLFKYIK